MKNKLSICFLVLALGLGLLGQSLNAEEFGLSNALEESTPDPQTVIVLPSGHQFNPWVTLPEGWFISSEGNVVNEDGVILKKDGTIEYPFGSYPEGYVQKPDGTIVTPEGFSLRPKKVEAERLARLKEQKANPSRVIDPKIEPKLPKGAKIGSDGKIILPNGQVIEPKASAVKPLVIKEEKPQVIREEKPTGPLQLWSMLPLTEVPKPVNKPETKPVKPEAKPENKPIKPENKPETKPVKPENKPSPKPETKPIKPEAKPLPKQPTPPPTPKPRIGEQLHIPPEAIRTGKLDFLEGCWQGTRPEYFSKRTIYECFCFGKQGNTGRRRVLDPQGHRQCVGATSARLSSGGVLSVSSQGAYCSDGERWGQAEMTCRGKGQRTPCSWTFKDANGGRQAYEIPFVRVQSCGRR